MTGLDAALAIGVLVQVTKLADIMLRPHQQKWVQDKCETLALRLSEVRTIELYRRATSSKRLAEVEACSLSGLFGLWALWSLQEYALMLMIEEEGYPMPPSAGGEHVAGFFCVALSPLLVLFLRNVYARLPAVRDFLGDGRTDLKSWIGMLITLASYALVTGLLHLRDELVARFATLFLCALAATFVIMSIMTASFVVAIRLATWILIPILECTRGFAWRIVEYNKGAWAALTLLATFGLGVADVYVKTVDQQETATAAPVLVKP